MKRHPDHIVKQARRLSIGGGLSYVDIGRKLGVHSGLVSSWCRDLMSSRFKGLISYNYRVREELKQSEHQVVDKLNIDPKFVCALIYGCEGSKYPATVKVSLTNSDPELIRCFVVLLREAFELDETKWRVQLQVHVNQDYTKLVRLWSRWLNIPRRKFIKPTVTFPQGKKHRNHYYGTCSVRYYDYRVQLKLIGIFEEYLRKFAV